MVFLSLYIWLTLFHPLIFFGRLYLLIVIRPIYDMSIKDQGATTPRSVLWRFMRQGRLWLTHCQKTEHRTFPHPVHSRGAFGSPQKAGSRESGYMHCIHPTCFFQTAHIMLANAWLRKINRNLSRSYILSKSHTPFYRCGIFQKHPSPEEWNLSKISSFPIAPWLLSC